MSELLEEARERRDKAELSTESSSNNWLNDSYYLGEQTAWQEAIDLIEKHEKPKGLLQCVPSKMSFTMAQQRDYQWLWDRYNNEHSNEFSGNAVSYAIDDLLSSDYIPACKTVEKLKEVVKVFCDEWEKEYG